MERLPYPIPLRVAFRVSLPPLAFSLPGSVAGRREDGLGGLALLVYSRVGCSLGVPRWRVGYMPSFWSSSLVSGGHDQGISKLRFTAAVSRCQPAVQAADGEASISSNKAREGSCTCGFPENSLVWWSYASSSVPWRRLGKMELGRCLNNSGSEVSHCCYLLLGLSPPPKD